MVIFSFLHMPAQIIAWLLFGTSVGLTEKAKSERSVDERDGHI